MSQGLGVLKPLYVVLFIFGYLICIAPSIAGTYFALNECNDPCQKGDRGGLNLSEWLEVSCIIDLVLITLLAIALGRKLIEPDATYESVATVCWGLAIVFVIIYVICLVVLRLWGIVILATPENNACVGRGTDLGIASLCYIVISTIMLAVGGCIMIGIGILM